MYSSAIYIIFQIFSTDFIIMYPLYIHISIILLVCYVLSIDLQFHIQLISILLIILKQIRRVNQNSLLGRTEHICVLWMRQMNRACMSENLVCIIYGLKMVIWSLFLFYSAISITSSYFFLYLFPNKAKSKNTTRAPKLLTKQVQTTYHIDYRMI